MRTYCAAIILLFVFAVSCSDDVPVEDTASVFFDLPKVPTPNQDTSEESEEGPEVNAVNECGIGCPPGKSCAFCFATKILKCVSQPAGQLGAPCTVDEVCQSKRCLKTNPNVATGVCVNECIPESRAICSRPGNDCLPGISISGHQSNYCQPVKCGQLHSVCSEPQVCECESGLTCRESSAGYHSCERQCKADEDCQNCDAEGNCVSGYRCYLGYCEKNGLRPATSPCMEPEDCESGQCELVPGTEAVVCLGTCTDCTVCSDLGNGCGGHPATCSDGVCVPLETTVAGTNCHEQLPCPGTEGPDGGPDGGPGGGPDGGTDEADGGSGEADGGSGEADGGSGEADGGGDEADGGSDEADGGGDEADGGSDGGAAKPEGAREPQAQEDVEEAATDEGDPDAGGGDSDVVGGDQEEPEGNDPEPPLSTLACVAASVGYRCTTECQIQADCLDNSICRNSHQLGETALKSLYCVPTVKHGVGDCCGLTAKCVADKSTCVVDGAELKCALECSAETDCPPEYECAASLAADGSVGTFCVQEAVPVSSEVCNGKDDDLDGFIDEADGGGPLSEPCYEGLNTTVAIGICKSGKRECKQGQWGNCQGDKKPILDGPDSPAGCDGFDNDCDGGIDEGCPCESGIKTCGSTTGQCQSGIQQCQNGQWSECQWGTIAVSVWPEPELCDGKDNDCDGYIDNQPGVTTALVTVCGDFDLALAGIGQCTAGTKGCDSSCEGAVGPEDELCADNIDNDCDGLTDEGCSCEPVQPKNCGPSTGVCSSGIQSCDAAGVWSSECAGAVLPSPELCDGIDNDCDGLVDNVPGTNNPIAHSCWDLSIDPDALKVGLGVCGVGNRRCYGGAWGPCVDQVGPSLNLDGSKVEQCDGKDNNCDGSVDELCDCSDSPETISCGSSVGACSLGTQKCVDGQRAECVGGSSPKVEECNGIDDNCDGLADQVVGGTTLKKGCYDGPTPTLAYGECSLGTKSCIQGSYSVCESQVMPVAEICNGLDDDCDGVTDESCACADGETQPCGSDQGHCESGVSLCIDLQWSELCMGAQHAEIEDCNGLDDDCDGKVDNQQDSDKKISTSCYTGPPLTRAIGECKAGVRKCGIIGSWTSCVGQQLPAVEDFCGDELDNDCDGVIDEGCDCDSMLTPTRICGLNAGACSEGEQLCQDGLWASACSGVLPTTENCNGLDDDCDGGVDTNPSNDRKLAQSCYDGGAFTEGVGPCKAGKRLCQAGQYSGPCLGQHTPAPGDICGNGQDDDCNSLTDVDCPVGN